MEGAMKNGNSHERTGPVRLCAGVTSDSSTGCSRRPKVLDLFAGAGGMSLGFEAAGFDVVGAVEIDPVHCAIHEFNFPDTRVYCSDIRSVSSSDINALLAGDELDVLVGGPPCQGFSQIGYRRLEDPRNGLVFEYCRLVRELRPKYFVFENVPGMNLGDQRTFVADLLEEFRDSGYEVVEPPRVLNATEFGVPQLRKRFIVLGYRRDCNPLFYPVPSFAKKKSAQMELLDAPASPVCAKDALSDLESQPTYNRKDQGIPPELLDYDNFYRNDLNFESRGQFGLCHRRTFRESLVFGHIASRHTELSVTRFSHTEPGKTESVSRFFKLHPEKPSNTLRAGTDTERGAHTAARPIHYKLPRCISVREGARLHSYPDWFQFHHTVWHGFRQLGNSVAPLFGKALADSVVGALGIEPRNLPIRSLDPSPIELLTFNMSQACAHFGVENPIPKRVRGAK